MESTDARVAFPSFDEPAYKATFDITAIVDKGDTAISNNYVVSDQPGPGDKHTVKFATTPKMSSYLVALSVGDWKCEHDEVDGIKIGVCTVPGRENLTRFPLDATKAILHYYNTYYSIKYPLKKLDEIAVPDFQAGAMETGAPSSTARPRCWSMRRPARLVRSAMSLMSSRTKSRISGSATSSPCSGGTTSG